MKLFKFGEMKQIQIQPNVSLRYKGLEPKNRIDVQKTSSSTKKCKRAFVSAFRSRISYRRHDRRPRLSSRTWPRPLSIFSTLTETRGRWQERRSSTASIAGGRKSPSRSFFLKKWVIPCLFLFIFVFSIQLIVNKSTNVQYKYCRWLDLNLGPLVIGSDRSTNWATTSRSFLSLWFNTWNWLPTF